MVAWNSWCFTLLSTHNSWYCTAPTLRCFKEIPIASKCYFVKNHIKACTIKWQSLPETDLTYRTPLNSFTPDVNLSCEGPISKSSVCQRAPLSVVEHSTGVGGAAVEWLTLQFNNLSLINNLSLKSLYYYRAISVLSSFFYLSIYLRVHTTLSSTILTHICTSTHVCLSSL